VWSLPFRACLVSLLLAFVLGLNACAGAGVAGQTPETTSYAFDAHVTDDQRAEIAAAVAMTSDWLASQAGMAMPVLHITAEPDGVTFIAGLRRLYAVTDIETDGIRATIRDAAAITVGHDILLIVNDRWQSLGPEKRSFVIAHEIFHVVQYALASGTAEAPAGGDVPGPAWLVEGSADFVAAQVIAASGGRSFDDYLREYEARGQGLRGSLRDLETVSAHTAWGAEAQYTLGFLATQELVERAGAMALFGLWRGYGSGESWETAFKFAFGETVGAFYGEFDGRRARVPSGTTATASY